MSLVDNTSKLREILDGVNSLPESGGGTVKEEQEKSVDITENGTTEVTPDDGKVLSKVTVNVDVQSGGDNPLQYATLNNNSLFREAVFPEAYHAIIRFKGNTSNVTSSLLFAYSNVEKATICVENIPTNGVNISSWFTGCRHIKEITFENDNFKILNLVATFNDCLLLESVVGKLDISNCSTTNNSFGKNYSLKEIRFTEKSIKTSLNFSDCLVLSDDSIQSIIDGLTTVEASQTLMLHANVKAKLTDTQLATITGKNWTVA